MPMLLWQRDFASDAYGVKNTFSSWDACMTEAYCKWPAIIGIVLGSLIVISVIWCCARCLCCGVECCCGCCSCFNKCCPSPRRRNSGYEKSQYPHNSQYHSPAPPMYFGGGYRAPQTATFDTPSNRNINDDSLPAMPTWGQGQERRVEDESMEMEKLDHYPSTQQQGLLHQRHESDDSIEHEDDNIQQRTPYQGQPNMYHNQNPYQAHYGQASPYQEPASPHDYSHYQQFVGSPTSTTAPSMYPPTYVTRPPSSVYTSPYGAPPGYQTAPPSIVSPPPQHAQMSYGMGRRPVQGSWRDV